MNLNKELFLNRDFAIKRKPRINLNVFPSVKKIVYPNQNKIQSRYSKRPRDYFFENVNTINNGKIINNIITSSEKSYFTDNNQSQINRDIYGYNNYIINKNSFNTINFSSKKNHKSKQDSISNYNYSDTPNYLTTYESNSNLKFNGINNYEYQYQTSLNHNENSFNNSDIKFMNMKLNFKILQQKLTHLNDIASSTEKNIYKTPYKININTMSGYNTAPKENNYPIKVFRSEVIHNNNKLKKVVKLKKNENEILYQKNNRKNDVINNNMKKVNNNNLNPNMINNNRINEFELIRNKVNNKKEKIYLKEKYFTNDNSLSKNYKKEESELSQLADNILAINKSSENLENNYFIKEKSFESPNIKNLIHKKKIIIKNKNKTKHYKYISNELEEISLNKDHNQTQNNNEQNLNLIVQHIFSYNSTENKKAITEKNSEKGKGNRRNKNNKNINIVQTNNFILNHLTEDIANKREQRPKIEKTYTDINVNKDNKNNDNKNNEEVLNDDNDNDNDNNTEDKIINSLIATASQNFKKEKEIMINNSITDFDKNFNKDNQLKKQNNKKVSFEDEIVYINYHQDYKVTNLHITDNDNKTIQFKPKDISKYIKKLTSNNKLKPIIINANPTNYINIINKIKIKNTNSKLNKIKTNQTIQKNIDYIKEVEKRNISKEKSQSKEKNKKKDMIINSINIKVNKSKINNKISVNKK